jgi:hypothetical protein
VSLFLARPLRVAGLIFPRLPLHRPIQQIQRLGIIPQEVSDDLAFAAAAI